MITAHNYIDNSSKKQYNLIDNNMKRKFHCATNIICYIAVG